MIKIKSSPTADTRTCDASKVTEDQLYESSLQHITDVRKGLEFFQEWLKSIGALHDYDKLTDIKGFYTDFKNKFETTNWLDKHRLLNRHHLNNLDGIPPNVNLLDVLEYITDCVMAGLARSGEVTQISIAPDILMKAYNNTIELLKNNVQVTKE